MHNKQIAEQLIKKSIVELEQEQDIQDWNLYHIQLIGDVALLLGMYDVAKYVLYRLKASGDYSILGGCTKSCGKIRTSGRIYPFNISMEKT